MSPLETIPTPALVLDRRKFEANCRDLLRRTHERGVTLRPHLKTLKSLDAARLAVDPRHGGLAVSTFNEAGYFADGGYSDIQLALCIPPGKLEAAADLTRRAPGFSFFVDSPLMAAEVASAAARLGAAFNVWIEVDSGERRTGVEPTSGALIAIAEALAAAPGVRLQGVATHAGHVYLPGADLTAVAEVEREAVTTAAETLRLAGYPVAGVSAGSTPTAVRGRSAAGLTEIRAGVYMVGDMHQVAMGSVPVERVGLSVMATVISQDAARGRVVVDAGGLALSKDRSTADLGENDVGYGLVVDLAGQPSLGRLHICEVYQEHGEIHGVAPDVLARLPIGARVRILPNHACMTAAMYDTYVVVDDAAGRLETWGRTNGWRLDARRDAA